LADIHEKLDEKPKVITLFRCDLDGTGVTYADISAGQGAQKGYFPSAVIDTINAKLLVHGLPSVIESRFSAQTHESSEP
jgi:hypothetical protein